MLRIKFANHTGLVYVHDAELKKKVTHLALSVFFRALLNPSYSLKTNGNFSVAPFKREG